MARKTLTTANSTIILTLPILPVPVKLEGYSTDDMLNQDELNFTDSVMGIDGLKSSGYIIEKRVVNLTFMPTSASIDTFNIWINAMKVARESLEATAMSVTVPGLKNTYLFTIGNLKNGKEIPDLKKMSESIKYTLEFESCTAIPIII